MPLDHERLNVYQRALVLVSWCSAIIAELGPCGDVKNQLDRASTSVPLNIAEGNGKFSIRDRIRFLDIAYGSALECAACLDVMVAKNVMDRARVEEGKRLVEEIVNKLIRLRESLEMRGENRKVNYGVKEEVGDEWFSLRDVE